APGALRKGVIPDPGKESGAPTGAAGPAGNAAAPNSPPTRGSPEAVSRKRLRLHIGHRLLKVPEMPNYSWRAGRQRPNVAADPRPSHRFAPSPTIACSSASNFT